MKAVSIITLVITLFCLVLPVTAAGPKECTGRQMRVIIESPNPDKYRVDACQVTLLNYTSKGSTKNVNITKSGDTFVDFTIENPITETDTFTLKAQVVARQANAHSNAMALNYSDEMTQTFSSGCDTMEVRWRSNALR
jgi:hypothetical protein